MTQSQLNRAVSRATGEDFELIDQRGFSLVDEDLPVDEADFDALVIDWDKIQADQTTSMFRDRQQPELVA